MATLLDLIGDTPLVEVTRLDSGPCRLFLKLESANPSGSIKDRPARAMIEAAEADGRLKAGGTIVEATAGNTGLGLAFVGGQKSYRTILVVPDKMSREKILHARAMGAQVHHHALRRRQGPSRLLSGPRADDHATTTGAIFINQFENPANPLAHEQRTAPELLKQMDGDVDAIVVGVGSGGTLTGVGRFMKRASPKTEMILADPVGSVLAPLFNSGEMIEAGSWAVEGIGEDFVPPNCDLSLVRTAYSVTDQDSFAAARNLLREEGMFAGSSSGTLLTAALRYCRRRASQARRQPRLRFRREISLQGVQRRLPGAGGLERAHALGTVRDLVINPHAEGWRRRGAAAGQSAHRVRAHARGRRVAIAGDEDDKHRRPGRRKRYARALLTDTDEKARRSTVRSRT